MADPSAQREVIPQTNQPSNLSFNSTNQHPSFHYPQVYVDPVTAAFYQRQTPQPTHPTSQQTQHAPRTSQQQQNPSYYIPDMATVALQQMHLQTMLQLQAQAHTQTHTNPLPVQRQSNPPQQTTQILPHHTTATSQSSVHGLVSIPQHITSALAASQSVIPPHGLAILPNNAPNSTSLPTVPEAQMASAYRIGRYTPAERKIRLERYREKRAQRNYNRRVKYDCRKQIADKRRRVQGRFVKREEEMALVAALENTNATTNGTIEQHKHSEATDATEEETKLQHPESSGSVSSVRHLEIAVEHGGQDDDRGGQESFCEQSDHILQTFR